MYIELAMATATTTVTVFVVTSEHGRATLPVGTTLEQAKAKARAAKDSGILDFVKLSREVRTVVDPYAHISDEQRDEEQAELDHERECC